jgi:hypothetical protein
MKSPVPADALHLIIINLIKWYEPQSKLWPLKTVQAPRNYTFPSHPPNPPTGGEGGLKNFVLYLRTGFVYQFAI